MWCIHDPNSPSTWTGTFTTITQVSFSPSLPERGRTLRIQHSRNRQRWGAPLPSTITHSSPNCPQHWHRKASVADWRNSSSSNWKHSLQDKKQIAEQLTSLSSYRWSWEYWLFPLETSCPLPVAPSSTADKLRQASTSHPRVVLSSELYLWLFVLDGNLFLGGAGMLSVPWSSRWWAALLGLQKKVMYCYMSLSMTTSAHADTLISTLELQPGLHHTFKFRFKDALEIQFSKNRVRFFQEAWPNLLKTKLLKAWYNSGDLRLSKAKLNKSHNKTILQSFAFLHLSDYPCRWHHFDLHNILSCELKTHAILLNKQSLRPRTLHMEDELIRRWQTGVSKNKAACGHKSFKFPIP